MAKRKPAVREDEPLPRRVNGPSTNEPWLEQKKHELKATGETQCYLVTDRQGLEMIAAGLIVDHVQEQAQRALAWMEETTP